MYFGSIFGAAGLWKVPLEVQLSFYCLRAMSLRAMSVGT